jgi:glycosyltransferase involved in cell wall biosynthesis
LKILFDHQTFSLQRYGGISKYFANLNKEINATPGNSSYVSAVYTENEYLKKDQLLLGNHGGDQIFSGKRDKIYNWNRRYSRWNVRYANYDVFHPTYLDPYFIKYSKKPFVVTIHDMIYEIMPDIFDNPQEIIRRKQMLINKADAILAISEYTKHDILKFYPEAENKISVVHHGIISDTGASPAIKSLTENYILYVGERWLYKNFNKFLLGISPLLQANADLRLICVGGSSFLPNEIELFEQHKIASQCTQTNATESELQQFYHNATLFVFPSLIEGFGLPILEAFAQSCPVVCSDNTCFPEIAGDAAIYFDPISSESIEEAVKRVLYDPVLRNDLKIKGRLRLANFSFAKCVTKTLAVYESL